MKKAKKVLAAVLMTVFLAALGGCVVVDRKDLEHFRHHGYWGYYDRDGHWLRR